LVARRTDRLDAPGAEIEQTGGTALAVPTDIPDRAQAESAVRQTGARFGRLDILVNNAGLTILGPFAGTDVDDWERMVGINEGVRHATHCADQASDDSLDHRTNRVTGRQRGRNVRPS
jgi:NADP-dependent 3-hydroxy acid dehydrogenase YdfG